jgi:predicted kinase
MIYILRGCSGSGKSTLANSLTYGGMKIPLVEADDFFLGGEVFPKYQFDPKLLPQAHQWTRLEAERLLRRYGSVCIANTFTEKWEMAPYIELAKKYKTELRILEPSTPWAFDLEQLVVRNQHGVPREIIEKQLARWTVLTNAERNYDFRTSPNE